MKKSTKIATALLSTVILASTLIGCAKSKPSETEKTSTTAEVPFAKVKWYVFGSKQVDHDMVLAKVNEDLKKKANVELDLQVIDAGTFDDKMKLIISSGEDYDLTFTASWRNGFYNNMSKDAYKPLDDLLNKYGPDIKKLIPSWLLDVARVNGKLYAIPNQQIVANQYGLTIQKGLLDKYKFDYTKVKELDDIEPFLKLIKENEPNLIPFKQSQAVISGAVLETIASWNAYIKKGDKSLKVLSGNGAENEYIAKQNKHDNEWYNKGYIRKDILTVKDDSADVKSNKYAVTLNTWGPGASANATARQGIEMVSFPIGKAYVAADGGISTMTAMNVNSKNPEAAMKLLNVIHTDKDVFNKLIFGIEGTHYTKKGTNRVEVPKDTKYTFGSNAWIFGNQFNAMLLPGQEDTVWEETDKLNKSAEVSVLRGFTFNSAPVQAELAQVSAVGKEYANGQFVAKDIAAWEKEVAEKKNKAGYQKILAEVQKQVDEWAKANGKK